MPTTATMMFGALETKKEIVDHLVRLRDIQDRTRGFTAFIPWTYQPGNTELGGRAATAVEYLKTLALSRIMLDNFPNIQASWVTQGAKIAQVALSSAQRFRHTMIEEMSWQRQADIQNDEAGDHECPDAGYMPAQRDTRYNI
jgi:cyclic dehypoxanthinyl futalosine synthase